MAEYNKTDYKELAKELVKQVSPTIEADKAVREWLANNGVIIAEEYGTFFIFDKRQRKQLVPPVMVYSEAVAKALDFCKSVIETRAIDAFAANVGT